MEYNERRRRTQKRKATHSIHGGDREKEKWMTRSQWLSETSTTIYMQYMQYFGYSEFET